MSDAHRTKIANSQILKRLIEAGEGKLEMSAVQATVGLGLLKKVMPDLSAVALSGDADKDPIQFEDVGASKLLSILDAIAERS